MRRLIDVIEEMLAKIPQSEKEFLKDLNYMKVNVAFAPPERMTPFWDEVSRILQRHMPAKPVFDWHYEVISIFTTKPVDDLRNAFSNGQVMLR